MSTIRIRRRLDSPIPQLPELSGLVGKEIEIVVREADDETPAPVDAPRHFRPVGAWVGPAGEFDGLMQEVADARDANIELDREARP